MQCLEVSFKWRRGFDILAVFKSLVTSLSNITIIAKKRMHSTFRPFKHNVLKKSVYGVIAAVVWVKNSLLAACIALLRYFGIFFTVHFDFVR